MDHPDYEALYKALVELDVTLWLHPSRPPLPDYPDEKVSEFQVWQTIGWPFDTTTAMHRIVFSGVFERYPALRIVTHHHGGFLPYYAGRMVGAWAAFEETGDAFSTKVRKPYIDHFKKFYCDTACNEVVPKVLEMALDFFGPERVLFGSDAPFGAAAGQRFTSEVLSSIDAMAISDNLRNALLSGNARQMLKIS
jgi:predicted TIM-barrel fold metal-dependent hydrolase